MDNSVILTAIWIEPNDIEMYNVSLEKDFDYHLLQRSYIFHGKRKRHVLWYHFIGSTFISFHIYLQNQTFK